MGIITCGRCNGRGYIPHYEIDAAWSELCTDCNGKGTLSILSDDIIVGDAMIYITKKEYEELLEYKRMYKSLCK